MTSSEIGCSEEGRGGGNLSGMKSTVEKPLNQADFFGIIEGQRNGGLVWLWSREGISRGGGYYRLSVT